MRRRFRGAIYEITVTNPEGVCKGIKKITLDGVPVKGNMIPHACGEHKVEVVLG